MVPSLEVRLMESSEDDVIHIADLVCCEHIQIEQHLLQSEQIQKGANGARANDTKGMKTVIIDWITPKDQTLNPHIPHNVKFGRGFNHERTGALLCPAGLDWANTEYVSSTLQVVSEPDYYAFNRTKEKLISGQTQVAGDQWLVFLYANYSYDTEDPWNGLLRSGLLVSVSVLLQSTLLTMLIFMIKAFKHIFTSPSSVDQEPRATRSGNARIHGMRSVTKASIAYVATQVG